MVYPAPRLRYRGRMRHPLFPWPALSLFALGACGSSEPAVGPATSAPAPSATISAPGPAPAAPAAPGDAGRLPRGAAVYVSVRLPMIDDLMGALPDLQRDRDRLLKQLGAPSIAAALSSLGVASDRPLLAAMLSPDEAAVRAGMEEALKDPTKTSEAQLALGSTIRVLLPLSPGADPSRLVDRLAGMEREPTVERCPASPSCQTAGGDGLVALIRTVGGIVSVRVRGDTAEIDQYTPYIPYGTDPEALTGLRAFAAAPLGGPEPPRCARFDPAAAASLCVDADRTAVLGMAQGFGIGMLSGLRAPKTIEEDQRLRVLQEGKREGNRNIELATPRRRLLDDGTMTFKRVNDKVHSTATWALTPESKPALEKALAKPTCAAGAAFTREVLPKLAAAFGDPGPDYARPKERFEHMKEAGWMSFPILFSRTWPNMLSWIMAEHSAKLTPILGTGKVCAVVRDGRLEIESGSP
jgi:hypothetical protein